MKPIFEKVASYFKDEEDCVIANMDADASHNKPIAMMYGVKSFPTIKFFGKGGESKENPIAYNGPRSEQAFVDFLNEHCGTQRAIGGRLNHLAGRLPSLDEVAQKFIDATADVRTSLLKEASTLGDEAKGYIHVMKKVTAKSNDYITKELKRYALSIPKNKLPVISDAVTGWNLFSRRVLWDLRSLTRLRSSSTFSPLSSRGRSQRSSLMPGMSCDGYLVRSFHSRSRIGHYLSTYVTCLR